MLRWFTRGRRDVSPNTPPSPQATAKPHQPCLAFDLEAHADAHGYLPAERAVFLARGGHAPGTGCDLPSAVPEWSHRYWCCWPDADCICDGVGERTRVITVNGHRGRYQINVAGGSNSGRGSDDA